MDLYPALVRRLAFRLDPERAHHSAFWFLERGWVPSLRRATPSLRSEVWGLTFDNPVGLAAGMDKDAVGLKSWRRLGFGFVEVGTVTPKPQPGNPQPRLFRLPSDRAIINRMGFNNSGAAAMAERLGRIKAGIPLGINLGKNKATPEEQAAEDYAEALRTLREHGDYFVVNVSSPNTPGLRGLQERGPLLEIAQTLRAIEPVKPILVKVAPDLTFDALDDVLSVCVKANLSGIVATNTTLSRTGLSADPSEAGGLSGAPLTVRADEVLSHLARHRPNGLVLIGVGGIMTPDDAKRKVDLGADLIQLYTGYVYGGPWLVPRILTALGG